MVRNSSEIKEKIQNTKELFTKGFLIGEINTEKKYDVYYVPIEFLTLNPRNSRLRSKITNRFFQEKPFFYYEPEGQKEITQWIFNTNKEENKKTKKDIQEKGQQLPALITADGLIINGNRRFIAVKSLYDSSKDDKFSKFKVVILDHILSNEYQKIKLEELKVQFGKDDTVTYKRLDIMLAMRDFQEETKWKDKVIQEHFKWEKGPNLKQIKLTLAYIDDYLDFFDLKDQYNLVQESEDQFKFLSSSHNKIEVTSNNKNRDWSPKSADFSDYKYIFFKLFRSKPSTIKTRPLLSKSAVFLKKDIWEDFKIKVKENYDKGFKSSKDYQKNQLINQKKVTSEDFEDMFESKTKKKMKCFLSEIENEINQQKNKNKFEIYIEKIYDNLVKIKNNLNEKNFFVKPNWKKKLKKNSSLLNEILSEFDEK